MGNKPLLNQFEMLLYKATAIIEGTKGELEDKQAKGDYWARRTVKALDSASHSIKRAADFAKRIRE